MEMFYFSGKRKLGLNPEYEHGRHGVERRGLHKAVHVADVRKGFGGTSTCTGAWYVFLLKKI
jgi:hypothetical protein